MNAYSYGRMAAALCCLFLSSCTGYRWDPFHGRTTNTLAWTHEALRRGTGTPPLPTPHKVIDWNDGGPFEPTFISVDCPHSAVVDFLVECEPLHRTGYGAAITKKNEDTTRYEWTGPGGPAWMTVRRLNADIDRLTLGN